MTNADLYMGNGVAIWNKHMGVWKKSIERHVVSCWRSHHYSYCLLRSNIPRLMDRLVRPRHCQRCFLNPLAAGAGGRCRARARKGFDLPSLSVPT